MFEKYRHLSSKSPIGEIPCLIPEASMLFTHLQPKDTHPKVLDVGAGQGSYSKQLEGMGYIVSAVDLDNTQYHKIVIADMHELPYEDNEFDQLLCTGTLEHAFAPYIVLSEFVRVLRDGGRLLISLPAADNEKMMVLPEHFTMISKRQMELMYCTKLGMKIEFWMEHEWDPVVGKHQVFVMDVEK